MEMKMPSKPLVNIADVALNERGHGEAFKAKWASLGAALGLTGLGCALHVVPSGKRAFPFHVHHVADELFFIISGTGEYRFGEEVFPVRPGDLLGAPAGKAAHQLVNTGTDDLRYLGLSTNGSVDVVEYPDSKKFGVLAGMTSGDMKTARFSHIGRSGERVDYWDGEGP
jgi:uncharacterized cupin superfamily protein